MTVEITYQDVPLIVEGTYYSPEDMEMYDANMTGYPGSVGDFGIENIYVEDSMHSIYELLQDFLDEIKDEVLNKML